MSDLRNTKPSSLNRTAWITGTLCIACCAAPLLGVAIGSATLAAFALYSEFAAMSIAVFGVAWFSYQFISRRNTPASRDIDCGCRPATDENSAPEAD